MQELTNNISPEDWKALGGAIGIALAVIAAVIGGYRKTQVEAGVPAKTDMTLYLLKEVRSLSRKHETLLERVGDMHEENGRHLEGLRRDLQSVYADTQVIRDRGSRQ